MKTKEQFIEQFKKEYPTLRIGNEEQGYTDLSPADYAATIEQWADLQSADEAKASAVLAARTLALAKLAALGLTTDDLKALGL